MALNVDTILHGADALLYLNGVLLENVKACNAKEEYDIAEVTTAGNHDTDHRFNRRKGSGSITLHKTNSVLINAMADFQKNNIVPVFTIVSQRPTTDGTKMESIQLNNVKFTDLELINFNIDELGETECPFVFKGWKALDTIA